MTAAGAGHTAAVSGLHLQVRERLFRWRLAHGDTEEQGSSSRQQSWGTVGLCGVLVFPVGTWPAQSGQHFGAQRAEQHQVVLPSYSEVSSTRWYLASDSWSLPGGLGIFVS